MSPYRLPMVISAALPIPPTDTDNIIRTVRHGLADVLEWLGEEVGPEPGECSHFAYALGTLFVSQEMHDKLVASLVTGDTPLQRNDPHPTHP